MGGTIPYEGGGVGGGILSYIEREAKSKQAGHMGAFVSLRFDCGCMMSSCLKLPLQ